MVKYRNDFPNRRELVIGTILRVNPYSAFISLDEYPGKEGMIHISEVARRMVRDIRKYVKIGQKKVFLVLRIDPRRGHIALSLKKVNKHSAEERMKKAKREQKAEKILAAVGKKLNLSLDKAYEEIGFLMQESFSEMFKALKIALKEDGIEALERSGIPEKYAKIVKETAEEMMELKEIDISGKLSLSCPASDGIQVIKDALSKAKGIEVSYVSTPVYSLSLKSKDPKSGEKHLRKAAGSIIKEIEKKGGQGSFEKSD